MKLLQSFLGGILAALGALVLEFALLNFSNSNNFSEKELSLQGLFSFGYLFLAAVLIEEILKYGLIRKIISGDQKIILNSIFLGLGFSTFELALVYWNYRSGAIFDFWEILGMIVVHTSTSAIIGWAMVKKRDWKITPVFYGLIPALVIHFFYNLSIISQIPWQKEIMIGIIFFLIMIEFLLILISQKQSAEKIVR